MTDFTDLISQAKKMQEKMKKTQDALKNIDVEGVSGGNAVKVIKHKKKVKQDQEQKSQLQDNFDFVYKNSETESELSITEILVTGSSNDIKYFKRSISER